MRNLSFVILVVIFLESAKCGGGEGVLHSETMPTTTDTTVLGPNLTIEREIQEINHYRDNRAVLIERRAATKSTRAVEKVRGTTLMFCISEQSCVQITLEDPNLMLAETVQGVQIYRSPTSITVASLKDDYWETVFFNPEKGFQIIDPEGWKAAKANWVESQKQRKRFPVPTPSPTIGKRDRGNPPKMEKK